MRLFGLKRIKQTKHAKTNPRVSAKWTQWINAAALHGLLSVLPFFLDLPRGMQHGNSDGKIGRVLN